MQRLALFSVHRLERNDARICGIFLVQSATVMVVLPGALSMKRSITSLALLVVVCVTVSIIPVATTARSAWVERVFLVGVSGGNCLLYNND